MSQALIRLAGDQDAPAITDIWNAMIARPEVTFTTSDKSQDEIAAMIADRAGAFWVLTQAGRVTGYATYGPFRSGPGYAHTAEHTVHLAPEAAGAGQGRALMQRLETAARDAGIHLLIAGIGSLNTASIAFHTRLGYTQSACLPQAGRKGGVWHDLILMHKLLIAP